MPGRDVEAIRDLIFYQYAKILGRDEEITVLDIDSIVHKAWIY